jgi:23S rRNA (pseudouridine1915-N3)-methyltransferase
MIIRIIAVGTKMPEWVDTGYKEFAKRLPSDYSIKLVELTPEKRTKNSDINRIIETEGKRILAALNPTSLTVALDLSGEKWSTTHLAKFLHQQHDMSQDIDLIIGGPDGLSAECLQKSQRKWALSPLTFPHPLVRIIVAEQLYRAWSILVKHPYHR